MSKKNKTNKEFVIAEYDEKTVPVHLVPTKSFIKTLSLDADKLFETNLAMLKNYGYDEVCSYWHPTDGYIFARGTMPVCLCAHMDKVPRYESIKEILYHSIPSTKSGKIKDVWLNSEQGIGGDDRCGVYAIFCMLARGHRPSILFCMGEEVGCCGSRKFTQDFAPSFLSDINAFIQIDRRGHNDCVRYTDDNPKLTKAVCKFGYEHAYGSFTDICTLMPHFGVSGVNLSSGYYHEHTGKTEYVSMKDVNYLIEHLDKILKSDIFKKRYEYKARTYSFYGSSYHSYGGFASREKKSHSEQLSLFKGMPYIDNQPDEELNSNYADYEVPGLYPCDYCGEFFGEEEATPVYFSDDCDDVMFVCPSCAESFIKDKSYIKCPSCASLFKKTSKEGEPGFVHDFCPGCGCSYDEEE